MEPDCYFVAQVCAMEGKWREKGGVDCVQNWPNLHMEQQQRELLPHKFIETYVAETKTA